MQILKERGLTVKLAKCQVGVSKVIYLGHTLSSEGVSPKAGLVQVIRNTPVPANKDQLRVFLDLAEYYVKFIPNYAEKTVAMRALMKRSARFVWSEECGAEFELVKRDVENVPEII
ncbi:uncharacterized protein [Ambystoma mexicanum]|uniref:uncharacterized protein n=1 Tax=Ambystoma mexicanum TaxID=8296 RepID=UPI0037E97CA6